jgi:23S rRNA (uridine2552-2'-O)-methyltransferase
MTYRRKDAFYARAKGAGYRSRAAYKLLELAPRYQLIRRGDHVVDLGAWPGGWLQVAAELVGPQGVVVGVDLQPIDPLPAPVSTIVGDARDERVLREVQTRCGGRVDVVLSDMAPKLTGVRDRDQAQATALAESALAAADHLLAPGGRLLVKLFTTPDAEAIVVAVRDRFDTVKRTRPEATRKGSAEMYLVALGKRDRTPGS